MTCSKLKEYDKAVSAYREVLRLKPDNSAASNQLGLAHLSLKQFPNALAAFQETIRLKPDDAAAHFNLGFTYVSAGQTGEALMVQQKLRTLDQAWAMKLSQEINKSRTAPRERPR